MSLKSKGIAAERDVVHKLQEFGFAAIRVAGSGSTKTPSTDILAGNGRRLLSIECKTTKTQYQYISHQQITDFLSFSRKFGAESWIAVKFARKKWKFLLVEDLIKTSKYFCITPALADLRGLVFEDLVENAQSVPKQGRNI